MGVCIQLCRLNNPEPIASWNGLAGNKDLFHALLDLPRKWAPQGSEFWDLADLVVRPADFAPWRAFVAAMPHNKEVFTEILDRLETDETLWLHFSY